MELTASQTTAERARAEAEEHQRSRLSAEERARKEQEDRAVWEQLAAEADAARVALSAELAQLQAAATATPAAIQKVAEEAAEAAKAIDLDEVATRAIIDQQLRDRGWEVDSQTLRYGMGARPVKNRSMAIAEWPTASGPADYALFVDTQCVALAEAKRRRKNVSAAGIGSILLCAHKRNSQLWQRSKHMSKEGLLWNAVVLASLESQSPCF